MIRLNKMFFSLFFLVSFGLSMRAMEKEDGSSHALNMPKLYSFLRRIKQSKSVAAFPRQYEYLNDISEFYNPIHKLLHEKTLKINSIINQKGDDSSKIKLIEDLLDEVVTINIPLDLNLEPAFFNPLFQAVDNDNLAIARLLLQHGSIPDTNLSEGKRYYPITHAKSLEMLKLLLDHGATVRNAANQDGQNYIADLFLKGNVPFVEALLESGKLTFDDIVPLGDFSGPLLMAAIKTGNAEMVRMLIKHGANTDISYSYHGQDVTPLELASTMDNKDIIEQLML